MSFDLIQAGHEARRIAVQRELVRWPLRDQLGQALVQHGEEEEWSWDLVASIEQGEAWLCILYPDYMHDLAKQLLSLG